MGQAQREWAAAQQRAEQERMHADQQRAQMDDAKEKDAEECVPNSIEFSVHYFVNLGRADIEAICDDEEVDKCDEEAIERAVREAVEMNAGNYVRVDYPDWVD